MPQPENIHENMSTLGGGCFWCLEAVFEQMIGVHKVESGYSGGSISNPGYREVCTGQSGHAEVVQVSFDPGVVSFGDVLDVFFAAHDPTTLNRQGADVGTQYRSAIFYHSLEQKEMAQQRIAQLNAQQIWSRPIVTEVVPLVEFFKAEDYHQGYFRSNPQQAYCQAVVEPKVAKFRKQFANKLKTAARS
jgi:peptide-methionine (S)-S-oxide reductase